MATLSELRNAVESALNLPAAGATLQLNSNTRERAFEGYVFSLLVQAVRQAGGSAVIVGIPRRCISGVADLHQQAFAGFRQVDQKPILLRYVHRIAEVFDR